MWSPDTWNDVSVVAIVILVGLSFTIAVVRGWLVPGTHHREALAERDANFDRMVVAKDKTIANGDARSAKDQETIAVMAQTLAEKNASDRVAEHVLSAMRETLESARGGA